VSARLNVVYCIYVSNKLFHFAFLQHQQPVNS
jgi:hypothetical protein